MFILKIITQAYKVFLNSVKQLSVPLRVPLCRATTTRKPLAWVYQNVYLNTDHAASQNHHQWTGCRVGPRLTLALQHGGSGTSVAGGLRPFFVRDVPSPLAPSHLARAHSPQAALRPTLHCEKTRPSLSFCFIRLGACAFHANADVHTSPTRVTPK